MLVFVRLFKVEGDIYYNYLHIPCCNYSGSMWLYYYFASYLL